MAEDTERTDAHRLTEVRKVACVVFSCLMCVYVLVDVNHWTSPSFINCVGCRWPTGAHSECSGWDGAKCQMIVVVEARQGGGTPLGELHTIKRSPHAPRFLLGYRLHAIKILVSVQRARL
jgi:hypothetical protein